MNNMWRLALGLVGCLIAIWVITASDNKTYKVNYTTYKYNLNTDSLETCKTRTCVVTIDGMNSASAKRNTAFEREELMYEVWDSELSNNSTLIADSISINVLVRVD